MRIQLTAVYTREKGGGYSCYVREVPGAISQGETLEEARSNLGDALQLVLEETARTFEEIDGDYEERIVEPIAVPALPASPRPTAR